ALRHRKKWTRWRVIVETVRANECGSHHRRQSHEPVAQADRATAVGDFHDLTRIASLDVCEFPFRYGSSRKHPRRRHMAHQRNRDGNRTFERRLAEIAHDSEPISRLMHEQALTVIWIDLRSDPIDRTHQ